LLKNPSKLRLRREAHGSISVQERQPSVFNDLTRVFDRQRQAVREICGSSLKLPPQHHKLWPLAPRSANPIRRLDETVELHRRVVGRDPTRPVAQEILPVFEAHARRPEAPTDGVLQVMHPKL